MNASLPQGMSVAEVRSLLTQRRTSLTQKLIEARKEQRALSHRIDRLEAELAEVGDGEQVLDTDYRRH